MTSHYAFESRWWTPVPRDRAYEVLVDVEHYPCWWPQARAVARLAEDHALIVIRSLLPLPLELELRPTVRDRDRGVLEASLGGALVGFSRIRLTADGSGTVIHYEQEVTATGRVAAASRVARPLLLANHGWAMRGLRRGLVRRSSSSWSPRCAG